MCLNKNRSQKPSPVPWRCKHGFDPTGAACDPKGRLLSNPAEPKDPPLLDRLACLVAFGLAFVGQALAETPAACAGRNLIAELAPVVRDNLQSVVDAEPFARGNLWRASKDGQTVTLAGTYHLDDPRHEQTMQIIGPMIAKATKLLVEAGPKEEGELMDRIARDPSAILAPEGPTLVQKLTPAEWQSLSQAMRDRGIPPFMASRFRPWYVTMLLSVPPCALAQATKGNGLDKRVMAFAEAHGVPVEALEPYDTALRMFDGIDDDGQVAMVRSTLALEDQAADQMATLAAAYFAGDSRLIWEYTRHVALTAPGADAAQVNAEFSTMEEAMMNARNRNWISGIEAAAAKGPVFVAFGSLHLSGKEGVLALLQARGWVIVPLAQP